MVRIQRYPGNKPSDDIEQTENEEQAVIGVRDNDIRKNGMGTPAAVAENPEYADIRFHRFSGDKVCDVSAIISVDAAVTETATDGTGFLIRLKMGHVSVKERF